MPTGYIERFFKAFEVFNNQLVFDPIKKIQCTFQGADSQIHEFAGKIFECAMEHAQGRIPSRSNFVMEQVDIRSMLIRIPEGCALNCIHFKWLDIWHKEYSTSDGEIPKHLKIKFNEDINYFNSIIIEKAHIGVSNFWNEDIPPLYFDALKLGLISNPQNIFPFKFVVQDNSGIIKCMCGNEAIKSSVNVNKSNGFSGLTNVNYHTATIYKCSKVEDRGEFILVQQFSDDFLLTDFIFDSNLNEYIDSQPTCDDEECMD